MQYSGIASPDAFSLFGDLLKYLRRREQLTQLELSIKVGYSEAQISRLEKNQRLPDPTSIKALFIPALHLEDNPAFANRLVELAQSAHQAEAPAPGITPYKGLLYFDEPDADLFFGRQGLTAQLVQHVMDLEQETPRRFLAVVGASGSGKSSLVRAGLAVALRKVGWEVLVFTPGVHPLKLLEAQRNARQWEDGGRGLILVDQFEEVFTLCRDELERIAFIEKLLSYAQEKSRQYSVVIALRADFYAHCSQYPLLRQAVASNQEYIGQMTLEELRQAIEEPARCNGWELEPGLVDVMLQDLSTHGSQEPEPGALPLLSHALLATWENRRGRLLTLSGYHVSGGVRGAIAETAESVFTDQLNGSQQEIAREVFLRLTELGEGTEDTRRRAALAELGRQYEETAQFRSVLNTLAEARLITLNEDSAEVAHEALIREWQRLHEWLTQDREGLLLHRHLTEASQEWEQRGRDAAELYRGARLAQASEWATANAGRLNQAESDFLATSVKQEQHEALEREAQRQRELEIERQRVEEHMQSEHHLRRRAIYLGFALAGAFLLLLVAIVFARQASQNYVAAQQQTRLATSRELANAALVNIEVDQDRGLLLAMQAVEIADIPEARNALHQAILSMRLRNTLIGHTNTVYGVAFTPGSAQGMARLATGSEDGSIKIWGLDGSGIKINDTPVVTITPGITYPIAVTSSGNALSFSSDGKQLASFGNNHTAQIWDASTGKLLQTLSGHAGNVWGLAFSPSEDLLVTGSEDGTFKIWDAHSGQAMQTITGTTGWGGPVAFSMDGSRLAVGYFNTNFGGTVTVWDRNKQPGISGSSDIFIESLSIDTQFYMIASLAFSPDGNQLAVGSYDIKVYDIYSPTNSSPTRLVLNITAHQNPINGLFYSPDGKRLISGSADGTAKVWNSETGQLLFTLPGNAGPITSVAHSNDGKVVFTAHWNGQLKVWDISAQGNQEWLTIPDMSIGFDTRPGNRLVGRDIDLGNPDCFVLELSPDGNREISRIDLQDDWTNPICNADQAVSKIVTLNFPVVHVWDMTSQQELNSFSITRTLTQAGHTINDWYYLKLSPDGTCLATGGSDGLAFLWDVQTGKVLYELHGHTDYFDGWDAMSFSPDGTLLVTANEDGSVRIWDVSSGAQLQNLPGHSGPYPNVVFSSDGKRVLATGEGSKINLWDAQTGQLLLTLPEYPTLVDNLGISPDGKFLAAAMIDGTAHVWDAATGQEQLTLPGFYIRFTDDGEHLLAWTLDTTMYGYSLDINELMELARSRLTRGWTQDECVKFLHTEVCPQTP
jgi:WD40 repeat protein/transcriptional regulator with XRE-family HTH domain